MEDEKEEVEEVEDIEEVQEGLSPNSLDREVMPELIKPRVEVLGQES